MYLGSSWSFERDFRDYTTRQEDARLTRLVDALARGYAERGNWDWIVRDRGQWFRLIRENLGQDIGPPQAPRSRGVRKDSGRPAPPARPAKGPPGPQDGAARPPEGAARPPDGGPRGPPPGEPPIGTLTLSPYLLLLDTQRNVLEGPGHTVTPLSLKPISVDGALVGYLGYSRRTEFVQAMDSVFAQQQDKNFIMLALGMLITAIALAAGIARYLARPIQELARGTTALIQGRYDVRTGVAGRDELAQLAAHFNVLAQTLEANRTARQQWIADIAHELRTPLAVLQAEIEAMQDGVRPLRQENLASLAQEVERLSRLVGDLQTLSLSDMGALSYNKVVVDLNLLLTEVLDSHRSALADAGIEVELVLHGDNTVFGDPIRLAQMLGNLLQNTRRYTDRPGRLRMEARTVDGRVELDWADSSPGVNDADLPHLTDRLFRVEGSRSRDTGGAGLGLAIVRAIVDAHAATIEPRASDLGGLWWHIVFPQPDAMR